MSKPWIYDANGRAVSIVRPVGFARPLETREYEQNDHAVQGHVLTPTEDWHAGPNGWPYHGMPGPTKGTR